MQIISEKDATLLNPLWLAFVGDAVWQYNIRAGLLAMNPENALRASEMHRVATGYECATFQSELFRSIDPYLTEVERDLVKRAKNSHNNNVPKSTTLSGYKRATALESLIGFWYLTGNEKKIDGLVNIAEKTEKTNTKKPVGSVGVVSGGKVSAGNGASINVSGNGSGGTTDGGAKK